ncbi:MAG: hypothetical protein U0R19_03100 [Bryobacteraceae bacterium]
MYLLRFILTALIVVAMAFPGALSAQNGTPPQNVTVSWDIYPGAEFGSCTFPINLSAEGKSKTIVIPGGKLILTSPGLVAVVTNLNDPSKKTTITITGSFHVSPTADGGQYFTGTGRNFLTDPLAGVVVAIGNVSWAVDATGKLTQPLKLQGGHLINICELLK